MTPGRIVAAQTFGYWTAFFGTVYEDQWRKELHKVTQLPEGAHLSRKQFAAPLAPVRELRNRIAHHEPIITWNLPKHYEAIMQLTAWLSPSAADWCRGCSRFKSIYPDDGIALAKPNEVQQEPSSDELGSSAVLETSLPSRQEAQLTGLAATIAEVSEAAP